LEQTRNAVVECAFTDDDIDYLREMKIGDKRVTPGAVELLAEIGLAHVCAACRAGKHGEWAAEGCDCVCHPLGRRFHHDLV